MKIGYVACFSLLVSFYVRAQNSTGVFTDTIICSKKGDYSYALYTPALTATQKPAGLLFFFEPGGRATLPLKLYSEIADTYSLILACSWQSRNGPNQNPSEIGYAVMDDIKSKHDIKQIWLSGFSGGARAASLLAIKSSEFAGVIACGAAFPSSGKIIREHPVSFSEIIGTLDMNYLEAIRTRDYLAGLKNPSLLVQFDGGHQWPPPGSYEQAVRWQFLVQNKLPVEHRASFFNQLNTSVNEKYDSGFLYPALLMIDQPIPNSSEKESKYLDSLKSSLTASPHFVQDKTSFDKALDTESKLMNTFFNRFYDMMANASVDSLFERSEWIGQRKNIDKLIRSEDKYQSRSGKRLLDFCWRRCIEQYYIFLELKLYDKSLMAAKIWNAFDPEYPDPLVLMAKAYILKGSSRESVSCIQQAVKKGFSEKSYLLNDAAFQPLHNTKAFQKILTSFDEK